MTGPEAVVIVGAGGFAREVAWLARRLGREVLGFLDDDPRRAQARPLGLPVLGPVASWPEHGDAAFVVGVGAPRARQDLVRRMEARGRPRFVTLVDPAAVVSPDVVALGRGCIVGAGTVITVDVVLGDHVVVNLNCSVGHDARLGDFCTVAPLAALSGGVVLEDLVEVGTGAAVRQGLRLGRGSVVGMGAVLTKDAPAGAVLVGNPARPLVRPSPD